jgi:putative ubiquitin-RnfH superfamily antitoxin RatB of RatAB toxin-antitoxin module
MMSDIFVKVVRVPGAVTEVALSQGATVADALSAAGISSTGSESIRVGAADATVDTSVGDGDRVVIAQGAKGN